MPNKRTHGTGSVIAYKDGHRLRWTDPLGVPGSKVFRPSTAKQAEAELRRILTELDTGSYHDERKGNILFSDFAQQWLEWKEPQVAHTTFKNYPSLLKTTLLPTFGAKKLNQINERMVDTWWAKHAAHPVNRRNAYFLLRNILKQAVRWKLIAHLPIEIDGAGADASQQRPTWTVEDFDTVLSKVAVFYRAPLEIMFAGHLRLGELVALNGSDIKGGYVTAKRQRTSRGQTTDTKTKQHKTIQLLKRGRDTLATMPRVIGDASLFPGERSARLPRASLQKAWNDACEAAGYEDFHVHDIRHIGLSLIAESKQDRKVIQERAGHASATSTDRYIHTSKRQHEQAVEDVDALIEKLRKKKAQ